MPRHLTHFTQQTLREALATAGFEVRSSSGFAPEYDCFSFAQSVSNRIGLPHNLLYHLLRVRGAKVLGKEKTGRLPVLLSFLLAPLLGLLGIPATLLAAWCDKGATMTLYAQKKVSSPEPE